MKTPLCDALDVGREPRGWLRVPGASSISGKEFATGARRIDDHAGRRRCVVRVRTATARTAAAPSSALPLPAGADRRAQPRSTAEG